MTMNRIIPRFALLFVSACVLPPVSAATATDRSAAEARAASYVEAFNRRDVDACAEHWSETAEYILANSGQRVEGRNAIRAALAQLLDTDEGFELSTSDQRFRSVSKDVVIEEGVATLVSASHGIEQANYLVVHVKRDGKWYRNSVRETTTAASHSAQRLGELAWLIGKWHREDDHGAVQLHARWMKNKRFIELSFEINDGRGDKLSGKQIIGRDPSSAIIRSWTFDSQGGFEEAVWTRDQQGWLVKVSAVFPDGSTGSEQRVLARLNEFSFTHEVIEQQVNGRLLPGAGKVTLTKVTDKASAVDLSQKR